MGIIKDLLARANSRKQKQKEYEENDRIVNSAETKKLSHYERELVKKLKAEKEDLMKQILYWEEKKQEALDKMKSRQMMEFTPELFNQDVVLTQKNIFLNGGKDDW